MTELTLEALRVELAPIKADITKIKISIEAVMAKTSELQFDMAILRRLINELTHLVQLGESG